ncbi:flagellar export protein FliJ [Sinomonas susongensis]|uniref:flagellar export protein FliJ n=1 Tax=Sinomonas susongensis TaxID=1324851 RepID=UPI00110857C1|nr:flagellar export protein FliJ [Sinomonas susongensis]
MNRQFPLAGLLRLRRLEQDQAAARFGAVNAQLRAVGAQQASARADAEEIPSDVDSSAALLAVAAARAASASLLAELDALAAAAEAERGKAQHDLTSARARTVGLEKLEARHDALVDAAELAAEQGVLDDLGSSARLRQAPAAAAGRGGSTT